MLYKFAMYEQRTKFLTECNAMSKLGGPLAVCSLQCFEVLAGFGEKRGNGDRRKANKAHKLLAKPEQTFCTSHELKVGCVRQAFVKLVHKVSRSQRSFVLTGASVCAWVGWAGDALDIFRARVHEFPATPGPTQAIDNAGK